VSGLKEFVELDKSVHDRDSFDCGETELNTFIKKQAAKHMHAGISRTICELMRLLLIVSLIQHKAFIRNMDLRSYVNTMVVFDCLFQ
jgi:hypothetical protein